MTTSTATSTATSTSLEKVRHMPGKITARCPACAEEGADHTGNHLAIFESGKFTCIREPEHSKRIWELVGIHKEIDHEERRKRWREDRERRRRDQDRHRRLEAAKSALPHLIEKWSWDLAELFHDSPTRPSTACDDPSIFLAALFNPKSLLWTGEVFQSGEKHRERWRTTEDWFSSNVNHIGPMTTPSTWKAGTTSRTLTNIETAPYIVLDFDGPKGWTPRDQADLDRHLDESLAITRWLKDSCHWNLAAIVHTGNKSLHCWFDHPSETVLAGFRETLPVLGIDPSLIGHPEHPARLPGQVHDKSGNKSRVLYLR